MAKQSPRKIRLSTQPSEDELRALQLGDVVYLHGSVYTAREGAYIRTIEEGQPLPLNLPAESAANFHCSPAASINDDGSINMGAVTATASFRFSKWLDQWFKLSGAKLILGKGGMTSNDYRRDFVPNGAIYLTTVGYGTGALLGRGVKQVRDVFWADDLGLAQAIWLIDVEEFGPFIVESDFEGNSLFERENARVAESLMRAYEGTKPAVLKRFGETDDRTDELI